MKQMAEAMRKSGVAAQTGHGARPAKTFGQVLREEREDLGVNVSVIANKTRSKVRDVYAWESDEAAPDAGQLRRLCIVLRRLRAKTLDVGVHPITTQKSRVVQPKSAQPRNVAESEPEASNDVGSAAVAPVATIRRAPDKSPTTKIEVQPMTAPDAPVSQLKVISRSSSQYTNVEEIDPSLAETLLKANVRNRSISQPLVESIARDIVAGEWRLTHQGIALDSDYRLLDGQHRLHAIVLAGRSVRMNVTYNVDPRAFNVIDLNNRPRSLADVFGLAHGTKNNSLTIAALKVIDALDAPPTKRYTSAEVEALYERYGAEVSWAARALHRNPTIRSQAAVVAGVAYALPVARASVESFVEGVASQVSMTPTMVALLKAVVRVTPCTSPMQRRDLAVMVMRCLRAHEQGEVVDKVFTVPARKGSKDGEDGTLIVYRHYRARREKAGMPT